MKNNFRERQELLKNQKEDSEQELREIELTIQKVKGISEQTKPNTTAKEELNSFLDKLNKQKKFNEEIVEEYNQSLEFVGRQELTAEQEDFILEQAREDYLNEKFGIEDL